MTASCVINHHSLPAMAIPQAQLPAGRAVPHPCNTFQGAWDRRCHCPPREQRCGEETGGKDRETWGPCLQAGSFLQSQSSGKCSLHIPEKNARLSSPVLVHPRMSRTPPSTSSSMGHAEHPKGPSLIRPTRAGFPLLPIGFSLHLALHLLSSIRKYSCASQCQNTAGHSEGSPRDQVRS